MKSLIKMAIVGACSFIGGVAVGIAGSKKYFERTIDEIVVEHVKNVIEEAQKQPVDVDPPKVTVVPTQTVNEDVEVRDIYMEDKADQKTAEDIVSIEQYIPEDFTEEVPEAYLGNKNGIGVHINGPFRDGSVYVIDDEEYDDSPDYTKTSIAYYERNQQFYDEHDEPIDERDIQGMLGSNIVNYFGVLSSDPDIVYVRNTNRNLNIEVARMRGDHDD